MNRYLKSIGGVGLVALLGVTMVNGVVDAQTNGNPGTAVTGEKTSKRDQFLNTLAGNLDVSVEALQTAFHQTVDEVGFGPGRSAAGSAGRFRTASTSVVSGSSSTSTSPMAPLSSASPKTSCAPSCKAARRRWKLPKSTARPRTRFAPS